MKFADGGPLTVTVVGQPDTDLNTDITFDQKVSLGADKIEIHPEGLSGVGGNIDASSIFQIRGAEGFTTGAYDIALYFYVHAQLHKDTSGRLTVEVE